MITDVAETVTSITAKIPAQLWHDVRVRCIFRDITLTTGFVEALKMWLKAEGAPPKAGYAALQTLARESKGKRNA